MRTPHIEGPAATIIIDRGNERMLAARDRMGERRLFYCRHGRTAAVADHPDALLDSPYASRTVDANGLNELFALGPARTPGKTPFRDIMELEPGCMLVADRSGVNVRRYYSMTAVICDDDAETAVKKVRAQILTGIGGDGIAEGNGGGFHEAVELVGGGKAGDEGKAQAVNDGLHRHAAAERPMIFS